MCIKPSIVHRAKGPVYVPQAVPCRHCWACLKNEQNDLIAKGVMEAQHSDWSVFLTLTFADDKLEHENQATVLDKSTLKRFNARMRKSFQMRYIAAGEYGERKGRAHYHTVLFGVGDPPDIPINKNFDWDKWPHGHVWADQANEKTIRYVAKYLTKKTVREDTGDLSLDDEAVTYSKRPPLGIEYAYELADQYARERVFPRTFSVNPPGLEGIRAQISGVSQNLFLDRLFYLWPDARRATKTEWMENAYLRYKKWLARRHWDKMSASEQKEVLDDQLRPRRSQGLTESQKLWQDLQQNQYHQAEQERIDRWIAERKSVSENALRVSSRSKRKGLWLGKDEW